MVSIHHVTSYPVSEFFLLNSPDEVLSIMAYTGRLRPKGRRLYVYERVGKLKGPTDTSCGCEKDKKTSWFSNIFILKEGAFRAVKRDAVF